jgi:hypothetical protein
MPISPTPFGSIARIDCESASAPMEQPRPQRIGAARKPVKHTVPGTLTPQMQKMIVSELRGGRSVVQVAKAYDVAAVGWLAVALSWRPMVRCAVAVQMRVLPERVSAMARRAA